MIRLVIHLSGSTVDEVYTDSGVPVEYVVVDDDEDMADDEATAKLPKLTADTDGEECPLSKATVHVGAAFPAIPGRMSRQLCNAAFALSGEFYRDTDNTDDDEDDDED